jgi:hypothetical protein
MKLTARSWRIRTAHALVFAVALFRPVVGCSSSGNGPKASSAASGSTSSTGEASSGASTGSPNEAGSNAAGGSVSAGSDSGGSPSGATSTGSGGSGTASAGSAAAGSLAQSGTAVVSDASIVGASATSPAFGPNVLVFSPSMSMASIQAQIDAIDTQQVDSQFGTSRYTFMFLPGNYALNISLGYYTQVLGLGASPDDVVITGSVQSLDRGNTSTLNFWRGVENLSIVPQDPSTAQWAVAQGATFRRVHVQGGLALAGGGTASGGFLADSKIDGTVTSGSQQQWFSRNAQWAAWNGGVWNMVFSGIVTPPSGMWPGSPYSVVPSTPLVQEKPFLLVDSGGNYAVSVPILRTSSQGISWSSGPTPATMVSLSQFYLAQPSSDTAATLNAALASGLDLLLSPGIYHLGASLQVSRADTIILGLGLTTLVPDTGTAAMTIADVDGVRVGGIIFDAGAINSTTLLQLGNGPSTTNHAQDPTSLYDVFCRVGGGSPGTASSCVTINSNDVVGDNLWLWRADHGAGVGWTSNTSANGLIVNGDRVTMYGLAVEHFQQYQTLWNGNGGQVYFYQSEMPYDPPNQSSWMNGTSNGYASYKVASSVTSHTALGLGVYCAFRQPVAADDAFEAPTASEVALHHLVTVWLDGAAGSAINHVLNGTGSSVNSAGGKATID